MTPTDPDDSPWNDLAAELGLDSPAAKPSSPRPPVEPPEVDDEFALDDADEPAGVGTDDTVVIPALQAEATAEDGDQPGEGGKKRRRRRRRRKKGGSPEGAAAEGNETATEGSEDAAEGENDTDADESVADDTPADPTGAEPASELFANWNVPAWEEIVAGLYRPER